MAITEEEIQNAPDDDGGTYSLKRFLTRSPASTKRWFLMVIGFVLVLKHVDVAPETLTLGGLALEATLDQFYVRPVVERQGEIQVLKGIDLGRQQGRPQLHAEGH